MKPMPDIEAVIEDFWRSRQVGVYFPPEWLGKLTIDDGYRVQIGLLARLVGQGSRHVGWKVGLTSEAMQQQFRVHEPVFGYLLGEGEYPSGVSFPFSSLIRPGIESEICVTMATDLVGPGVDEVAVRRAIASVRPSIELAETRGPFTEHLPVAIAENVQQKAVVLGPETRPLPPDLDLARVGVAVSINGESVATATGVAVLGDPLRSVAWMANKLVEYGLRLHAGQIVMTGSLTRQFAVRQGDRVVAAFDPLGVVEATFV